MKNRHAKRWQGGAGREKDRLMKHRREQLVAVTAQEGRRQEAWAATGPHKGPTASLGCLSSYQLYQDKTPSSKTPSQGWTTSVHPFCTIHKKSMGIYNNLKIQS